MRRRARGVTWVKPLELREALRVEAENAARALRTEARDWVRAAGGEAGARWENLRTGAVATGRAEPPALEALRKLLDAAEAARLAAERREVAVGEAEAKAAAALLGEEPEMDINSGSESTL